MYRRTEHEKKISILLNITSIIYRIGFIIGYGSWFFVPVMPFECLGAILGSLLLLGAIMMYPHGILLIILRKNYGSGIAIFIASLLLIIPAAIFLAVQNMG